MNTVLVAGFGPFGDVVDNPSSAIALALDGCVFGGVNVVGREMPVSHRRSIAVCEMWLEQTKAVAVLGIGIAVSRDVVTVERIGRLPVDDGKLDIDHAGAPTPAANAPALLESTLDCNKMAGLLDAKLGDDAGTYVCNSWLYQGIQRFDANVGFIHVPPLGLDTGRLLHAIQQMWGDKNGK